MRIIYLTLGFFVLLGVGAACRTPSMLTPSDCATDAPLCPPSDAR